jgi:hypothetical protein
MKLIEERILKAIQKKKENDLTKEIIIPLLEKIGYFKVEFFGGTGENGKDILCWEKDKFDEISLTVAQVKHFKFCNISSSTRSYQNVLTQLCQCFSIKIPFDNKTSFLPEKALLISTYVIDTKTILNFFHDHPLLINQKIKVIDGTNLVELILSKAPELTDGLLGIGDEFFSGTKSDITNEILLKALGYLEKKPIENIYTDIDFSIGKNSTQLFFNSEFEPKNINLSLYFDDKNWDILKKSIKEVNNIFELDFILERILKIESDIKPHVNKYITIDLDIKLLNEKLKSIYLKLSENYEHKRQLDSEKTKLDKNIKSYYILINELKELEEISNVLKNLDSFEIEKLNKSKIKEEIQKFNKLITRFNKHKIKKLEFYREDKKINYDQDLLKAIINEVKKVIYVKYVQEEIKDILLEIKKINIKKITTIDNKLKLEIEKNDSIVNLLQSESIEIKEKIFQLEKELKEMRPKFSIDIDGKQIADRLKSKRKWIENRVTEYNLTNPSKEELYVFINKCKSIIDGAEIIFANDIILKCLYKANKPKIRTEFESSRLKLKIEKIFDTGINLTVLGEAGAGKTTCLQMYVLNKSKETTKYYLFQPLSKVVQNILELNISPKDSDFSPLLLQGITRYLNKSGVKITFEGFIEIISKNKITLMLDGIDEAIKNAPWLNKGIKQLADKYKENMQIITTARTGGEYISDISFFTVSLLPFTIKQRNHFIESWFGPDKKMLSIGIKKHLDNSKVMGELVCNPLLTTILCVLAENELQLPHTEVRLYESRLDLLTGYYDNVKNIVRFLTPPQMLKLLSQKIAFYLHSNSLRDEDLIELKKISIKSMTGKLSIKQTEIAFNELIYPSNILVPMTENGRFGFGHLRYQEHLTALEIINNRSININKIISQLWWREVFNIYARMQDNITWLIDDLGQKGMITFAKANLNSMISHRPTVEQPKLIKLIEKYVIYDDLINDDLNFAETTIFDEIED